MLALRCSDKCRSLSDCVGGIMLDHIIILKERTEAQCYNLKTGDIVIIINDEVTGSPCSMMPFNKALLLQIQAV